MEVDGYPWRAFDYAIYIHTNESLRSAVSGMDINENDRILAICGSGDHGFAFLETGAKVTVVDRSYPQIDYASVRAEALRSGDIDSFLYLKQNSMFFPGRLKNRTDFFMEEKRIERIRKNLGNLRIEQEPQDILKYALGQFAYGERFNKIYLSNAIEWGVLGGKGRREHCSALDTIIAMNGFSEILPINGLIYGVCCGDYDLSEVYPFGLEVIERFRNLKIDDRLTGIAREIERQESLAEDLGRKKWEPRVFRRV